MTQDLAPAHTLLTTAPAECYDCVVLTYEERLVRRKRLVTVHDEGFLVDLPEVTNLDLYWGFRLEDGRAIQVIAAEEEVLSVTGPDLARLAWHIGNRHTPCQIEAGRLVIRQDHVLKAMLEQLGATVVAGSEPFTPELGAYGLGRPMGHDHGGHDHGGHDHGKHDHDHSHHGHKHVHHHSSHGPTETDEDDAEA
ncbi:urease accessory protein UreE [Pseudotabrizicola sp. L79]|uniref:urease accessory protein UreE n=1 Tax=Pseudotabrizicola sp. L79 TaxID=3118402 RepID=UPI002F92DF6F